MSYNAYANCVDCKALARKYKKPKRVYTCDPCTRKIMELNTITPVMGVQVQPVMGQQLQAQPPIPMTYVPPVPPLNVQPVYVEPGLAQQGFVQPIRADMNGNDNSVNGTTTSGVNGMTDMNGVNSMESMNGMSNMESMNGMNYMSNMESMNGMNSNGVIKFDEESSAQDQFSPVKVASFPYVEEKVNEFIIPGTTFSIKLDGSKLYHHEKSPKAFYWMVPKQDVSSAKFTIVLSNGDETTATDVAVYYTRMDEPVGIFRIDSRRTLRLSKYPNSVEPFILLASDDPRYEEIPEEDRGLLKIVVSYVNTPYSTKGSQPISADSSNSVNGMNNSVTKKKKKSKKTKKSKPNGESSSVPSFSPESVQSFEATREGIPIEGGTYTAFFRLKLVDSLPVSNNTANSETPKKSQVINPVTDFPPSDF